MMTSPPVSSTSTVPASATAPDATPSDELGSSSARAARRRRRLEEGGGGRGGMHLNLVSMIDVVFLLLMYFLLTTNFTLGEEVYHLDLPNITTAGPADPFDLPEQPIVITVRTIGPGAGDYAIALDLPLDRPPSTFEQLFRYLDDHQVRPTYPAGLFMPDTPIIIRPAMNTKWEHAVSTLNAALRAKYENVRMIEPE